MDMKTPYVLIALVALVLSACGGGPEAPAAGKVEAGPAQAPLPAGAPLPGTPGPAEVPVIVAAPAGADMQAMYRVTFSTSWSAAAFPTQYPANRHFSGLVGATHDAEVQFWTPGMSASTGIERMAEQGNKSALLDEIGAAAPGHVGAMLSGDGIGVTGNEVTLHFQATQRHPLVTLVSMVAPSPDWFVGVRAVALFERGAWHERVVVPLPVWDAGTDDGPSYSSADIEPAPHGVIRLLTSTPDSTDFSNGVHRSNGAFLASFTFERVR